MYPFAQRIISTTLLLMLRFCKRHGFQRLFAKLLREYNYHVLAFEILGQFKWKSLDSRFIRYSTLSCRHYHKEMIFLDGRGQLWKLIPMPHQRIFRPDTGMTVLQLFTDKFQRFLPPMKLYAAFQVFCQTRHTLQPTIEPTFKLRP